jgi:hypothetical protein
MSKRGKVKGGKRGMFKGGGKMGKVKGRGKHV